MGEELEAKRARTQDGLSISLFGDKWREGVEVRIGALEVEVRHLNEKVSGLEQKVGKLNEKADLHFRVLISTLLVVGGGVMGVVGKALHLF